MINDVIDLKNKNAKLVMDLIRFRGDLTKKDIAEQTGLSITTVSTICADLKGLGIVSEQRLSNPRVGRIPSCISFQYASFYVVGIDLQISNVLGLAISNLHNEVLVSETIDSTQMQSAQSTADFAKQWVDRQCRTHGFDAAKVVGIGISVPAIFDRTDGCLISCPIQRFNGVNLRQIFTERFRVPVYVDNASNFKAISIHTVSKVSDIVCLDISQGAGVGIICNDALLRGKNGYGAEIAHVPIGNAKLRCPSCGAYGCVEAELQLEHILQHYPYYDAMKNADAQWKNFVEYVRNTLSEFHVLLDRIGYLLGSLTSILVNLFDPSLFLITGYIADLFPQLEPAFNDQVQKRCSLSLAKGLTFQVEQYHSKSIYEGICDTIYDNWSPLDRSSPQ